MLGINKERQRLKNINVRYVRPQFTHRKKEKLFIKDSLVFSSGTIGKCLNRFLDKVEFQHSELGIPPTENLSRLKHRTMLSHKR